MIETQRHPGAAGTVSVLFRPSIVPVLDVFRSLGRLEDQYDLALLDGPEQALTRLASPELAKGIISDALLFAFALTRQRSATVHYRPMGSRHGSMDEYCVVTLIGASRVPDSELTFEAASALGVASLDFMVSLAADLVRQIDLASLPFDAPSLSDFRGVVGNSALFEDDCGGPLARSEFRFRF